MWNETRVSKLAGVDYPVMQGPFGGNFSTAALTAAVSNAGGIGGYGAYTLPPEAIYAEVQKIKALTDKPYNINLWVQDGDAPGVALTDAQYAAVQALFQPYFDELGAAMPAKPAPFQSRFDNQVQVILDVQPKVFSFVFGIPSADVLEQSRKRGILTAGAATTLAEALALDAAGVDMIIASGFEAGGHRPSWLAPAEESTMGTFVLTQLIKERVKVPVIAAGGIANGKGVAAALTLGADAVQVGTAFLATEESGAMPVHRERLFDGNYTTTLTKAFTGRLGRGIVTKLAQDVVGKDSQLLPFPLQSQFVSALRKAAVEQERWDLVFFWSGQVAPILQHRKAADLMRSLVEEASALMR